MIITLIIPGKAMPSDIIDTLRPSFLDITLTGLITLSSLSTFITFRFAELNASDITDTMTITKSIMFQVFLM